MGQWIATHTFDTRFGTVNAGRVVNDGDPLLDEAAPESVWFEGDPPILPRWARVKVVFEPAAVDDEPVIEATAVPGEKRPTRRRA